ncbi:MAG TPA: putative cytokinetic ring protein SteA [Acidimicrobiia bacterium]|nr:putative cytokinetic ring protein SteA [Acidimicrobiia bacterium]
MKLLPHRSRRHASTPHVVGIARVGRRTKDLAKRVGRGDIAVIDHRDLDRIAAESLLAAGVAAIVNADHSISGRYPNGGPERVVAARVPLLDSVGDSVMHDVHDGDVVEIHDDALWRNGEKIAAGEVLTAAEVEQRMDDARLRIGTELRSFARNTLEYIDKEAEQSFEPLELPPLKTKIRGRQALVVVRGLDYKSDLRALRAYIREYRPVLIAVDGGADALIDDGRTPDVIIGDFDSLSPVALHCGAELVHHVHPDGRAPGLERLEAAGVAFTRFVTEGTSEDAALLLAYEAGADLVVAVGTHATMVEFLDKGRRGMASTFLTRLRLGPMLVDAKGVSRLYQGRVRHRDMVLLVVSALVAMVAMVYASHSLRVFLDGFRLMFDDTWSRVRGWF